jgi:hypothetical protein
VGKQEDIRLVEKPEESALQRVLREIAEGVDHTPEANALSGDLMANVSSAGDMAGDIRLPPYFSQEGNQAWGYVEGRYVRLVWSEELGGGWKALAEGEAWPGVSR